jgi:hypothetical protein
LRITTFTHEWQRPPTSDEIAAEAERLSARVGYDSGPLGSYIPVRVTVTAELAWRYGGLSGSPR